MSFEPAYLPPYTGPASRAPHRPRTPPAAVALLVIGAVLITWSVLVGLFVACDHYSVCFLPTQPLTGSVGFSAAPDGGTLLVLSPATANQAKTIEAFGSDVGTATRRSTPLWRIDKIDASPSSWDGTVKVGTVPAGFRETVPLTVPPDEVRSVVTTNGCYGRVEAVPSPLPSAGLVMTSSGETQTLPDFRAHGEGFSACIGEKPPLPPAGWAAIAVVALGAACLIAGSIVAARSRRAAPGATTR